jgi:FtsZ-interacting cell division protein YlmF
MHFKVVIISIFITSLKLGKSKISNLKFCNLRREKEKEKEKEKEEEKEKEKEKKRKRERERKREKEKQKKEKESVCMHSHVLVSVYKNANFKAVIHAFGGTSCMVIDTASL